MQLSGHMKEAMDRIRTEGQQADGAAAAAGTAAVTEGEGAYSGVFIRAPAILMVSPCVLPSILPSFLCLFASSHLLAHIYITLLDLNQFYRSIDEYIHAPPLSIMIAGRSVRRSVGHCRSSTSFLCIERGAAASPSSRATSTSRQC